MNRKVLIGVSIAAACLLAVLVIAGLGSRSGPDPANLEGIAEAKELLAGVPSSGATIGDPGAPVEVIEYADLACPACKVAAETTIPALIADQIASGEAKLTIRPIAFIHPTTSERGALGFHAAARQDAGALFAEAVYANQGNETQDWLSDEVMEGIISGLGLDLEQWRADYAGEGVVADHQANGDAAVADQANSTPTFVVRGPGGERTLTGVQSPAQMTEAITAVS